MSQVNRHSTVKFEFKLAQRSLCAFALRGLGVVALIISFGMTESLAQTATSKKLAFLVGVSEYQRDGLTNLNFSDDDIEELVKTLVALGFETDVLLREEATLKAIQTRFHKFVQRTKNELRKEDVVFVALSGHGLQKETERDGKRTTEAYFCPYDASKFDNSTLLSINDVMRALETESSSSQKLAGDRRLPRRSGPRRQRDRRQHGQGTAGQVECVVCLLGKSAVVRVGQAQAWHLYTLFARRYAWWGVRPSR